MTSSGRAGLVSFLLMLSLVGGMLQGVVGRPVASYATDFAPGTVYLVPMNSATTQGSIELPTPNGKEQYELILNSLNPYHAHNKVALNPSDYPEGLFKFRISIEASTNASVTTAPVPSQPMPSPAGDAEAAPHTAILFAPGAARPVGETRIFRVDQGRRSINATLWRVSDVSYIYVDNTTPNEDLNIADVEYLGNLFDETIFPKELEVFGSPASNPDGDQHIVIVFSPFYNANWGDDFDTPHGYNTNRRNILFLYTPDPEGELGDYVKGIPKETVVRVNLPHRIAHVLDHLLNWTQHIDLRSGTNEYLGIWEGLANFAEYVALGDNGLAEPRDCITYFLRRPEIFSVLDRTVGYHGGHTAFVWYIYEIYGMEAIKKMSQTGRVGPDNVEAATGQDFAQIMRDWSAAMFLSNTDLNFDQRYQLRVLNTRSLRSLGPSEVELTAGDQFAGQIRSTGAYYFRLKASAGSAALALRIDGQQGSQMQASVIRLPSSFNIIADIPPNAYVANGILLELSIPQQLVLGQTLSLSGSVSDARAEQVFIGIGPLDGPTFWQNNGPAIWWDLAPVHNGRFTMHVAVGIPNERCGQRLEPDDYRLSITYEYANYAHWGSENYFPSIRILSKAPETKTTANTTTTRLIETTIATIASTPSPTATETGQTTTLASETLPVISQYSWTVLGLSIVVLAMIGVFYVRRRR